MDARPRGRGRNHEGHPREDSLKTSCAIARLKLCQVLHIARLNSVVSVVSGENHNFTPSL